MFCKWINQNGQIATDVINDEHEHSHDTRSNFQWNNLDYNGEYNSEPEIKSNYSLSKYFRQSVTKRHEKARGII